MLFSHYYHGNNHHHIRCTFKKYLKRSALFFFHFFKPPMPVQGCLATSRDLFFIPSILLLSFFLPCNQSIPFFSLYCFALPSALTLAFVLIVSYLHLMLVTAKCHCFVNAKIHLSKSYHIMSTVVLSRHQTGYADISVKVKNFRYLIITIRSTFLLLAQKMKINP